MRCEEICERFNLSISSIEELKTAGLLGDPDTPVCERRFSDKDVSYLNRILTFKNAGIELSTVKELVEIDEIDTGASPKMLKLLLEQRKKQMQHLHTEQQKLDRLDYLILELKNRKT